MGGLGFQELIVILVIAVFFLGGKKLPEVASSMGKAVREFKRGVSAPESIDVTAKPSAEQAVTDEAKKDGTHA